MRILYRLILLTSLLSGCSTVPTILEDYTPMDTSPTLADLGLKSNRCLALSGGGIRSGSVSLGVLQRLNEKDKLKDFSVISTVSGGGYPVYGILKELSEGAELKNLLDENGKYIGHVDSEADFIAFDDGLISAILAGLNTVLNNTVGLPIKIFYSGDLVNHGDVTIPYQIDLADTFTTHGFELVGELELQDASPPQNSGFPFPIFIASSNIGTTSLKKGEGHKYSEKDIFEITPKYIGSHNAKYYTRIMEDFKLRDAISMSSAAIDTPGDNAQKTIISDTLKRLGFNLGSSIRLKDGNAHFLSDGGFIDNTAIYTLLNKGCGTILALDASPDHNLKFDDWEKLRGLLDSEWDLPKIDVDEKRTGWELPKHVWHMTAKHKTEHKEVDIYIMKLGLKANSLLEYSEEVSEKITLDPHCNKKKDSCSFPLESTHDQSYKQEEFKAYRYLGKHLVNSWDDYLRKRLPQTKL